MLRKLQLTLLMVPILNVLHITLLLAQQIQPNTWVPNGPVHTMTRHGDIMYVGGLFSQVGRPLANGVVLNASTGEPRVNDEKFTGNVYHSVSDGQGGFFVSGNFATPSSANKKYLLHQLSNGEFSNSFNPAIPGATNIKVLAATSDRVLIRGGGGNVLYCVGYDGIIHWTRLADGRILEGIQSDGSIIVVGNFTRFEGQPRSRAAALNINTGELLPWNTGSIINPANDIQPTSKSVSLGIHENELFIRWRPLGNSNPNTMLASFDLHTGTPTGWILPFNSSNPSSPMIVHHGRVYIGTNSGQGFLILDASSKDALPNPVGISVSSLQSTHRITAMIAVDNTIYLGGRDMVDENGVALGDIVTFNETTLERDDFECNLMQNYLYPDENPGLQFSILTLSAGFNNIFVGGNFPSIMAVPKSNLFAYNVVTGELLPFNAQFDENGNIHQSFATDSRLYVSGYFVEVNGQERISGLASFNLLDGSLNEWNPDIEGAYGSVYGYGDRVYVYSSFTSVNGNPRNGVAAFDAVTGNLLDWSPNGLLWGTAMVSNDLGVFVAGRTADNTASRVFFYDHETGAELFPSINYSGGDGSYAVRAMATNETNLYLGGDFNLLSTDIEQFNRSQLASIDVTTGQVTSFNPDVLGMVTAIAATQGSIYVGGTFGSINGVKREPVAAFSVETGQLTDWKFKSIWAHSTPFGQTINKLSVHDDGVFIGGAFDRIDGAYYINHHFRASPDRSNVVTGRVFYDDNQNGVQDAGENGVPNLLMELQPGNIFYPTDANGNYTVYTGIGNYTIRPIHPTYTISVNPSVHELSFSEELQLSENNDFAIATIPSITDMGVTLTTDQNPRPGFYFNYAVTYTNRGTIPTNGAVAVTYDDRLLYQHSSVTPYEENNNVLTYNFTNVEPGESETILINMRVPVPTIAGSLLGEELLTSVLVTTEVADSNPENNAQDLPQIVIGSVDPNDKLVTPQGHGSNGYVPEDTDHLEYTIRFQNVGTAPATFVTLEDVLDQNFDISTFSVVTASHAYTYEIVDRTLNVLFDNINLIDSLTDEPNSHGYFTFTIGLNDDLSAGTQIQNNASIVFDYNLPIVTNTVVNTLRNPPYETTIFLPDSTGLRNSEILMPVFVNDWSDVLGAQFSVAWDSNVATFVGVESFALPGMDLNAFNVTNANDGYFSIAWSDPTITAQSLPDTTALFYIRFNLTGEYGSTTPLAITNYPVTIEAIAEDYQSMEVIRIDGALTISEEATILGTIQYSNDEAVQNVAVQLTGDVSEIVAATDDEGYYDLTFEPAENEESIVITPSKGSDPNLLNGIDVQDVASIRRHILLTELFSTAYQVIAADVSNNGVISIQDVILLQALILGVETDLPNGRQWTFVDAEHVFTNALTPFPYPQSIEVDLADLTQEDRFDFTAIKLGDVTMDRDNTQAGRTKVQEVVLEISAPVKQNDGTYEVSVSTLGFVEISAYQFTMTWDATKLEFLNVINENVEGIYGEHKISEGFLTTIWDETNGTSLSLNDKAQLFKLRFSPLTDTDPGLVEITTQLTAMRMFDDKLNRVEFNVRQAVAENKASGSFYPNPFDEQINISFTLQEAQVVKIEILNDLGQKVSVIEDTYDKGWNEVTINGSNFREGLYLVTINMGGKKEVTKLIKK